MPLQTLPALWLCRTWIVRPSSPCVPPPLTLVSWGEDFALVFGVQREVDDWADDALYDAPLPLAWPRLAPCGKDSSPQLANDPHHAAGYAAEVRDMNTTQTQPQPDPVIRNVVRAEALRLLELTEARDQLDVPWAIVHGVRRAPPLPADFHEARAALSTLLSDEAIPYRLVFETWDTLRELFAPPAQPTVETADVVRRLNALFGITTPTNTAFRS